MARSRSIALVGINSLALLAVSGGNLAGYPPADFLLCGVERLFAMVAHVGFSVMVWCAVQTRGLWLLFIAVNSHGLLVFISVHPAQMGVGNLLVETFIAAYAVAISTGAFLHYKNKVKQKERLS